MMRVVLFICTIYLSMVVSAAQAQEGAADTFSEPKFLEEEWREIRRVLSLDQPVRLLESSDSTIDKVQKIAVAEKQFLHFSFDTLEHKALRSEIFSVTKLRESDIISQLESLCKGKSCYSVEMYNYALDMMTMGIVELESEKVVAIQYYRNFQPEIPDRLKQLAIKIATESDIVHKALGYRPDSQEALMAGTKTALNNSRCERSLHLCVAPTFIQGEKALWAIVDLTDLSLVGIRWTNVGSWEAGTEAVTERTMQVNNITEEYCTIEKYKELGEWSFKYILTASDGLRLSGVRYKGRPIIDNVKLVDWHVSYSGTDGFGYSDAVGCPYFSTAAVVAIEAPKQDVLFENGIEIGYRFEQYFFSEGWPDPCNYNYAQRFDFYHDGRFRISVASLGRGCGNNGTYRPVIRIAPAAGMNQFYEWGQDDRWKMWNNEGWQLQHAITAYTEQGYQYKLGGRDLGFFMEPGQGGFNDGGRGDNAWLYVTKRKFDLSEGEVDLPTIGPCCNIDHRQGPEKFIEPEDITNSDIVIWYVPQLKNDDTAGAKYCWADRIIENGVFKTIVYPCFAGPMFVPADHLHNDKK